MITGHDLRWYRMELYTVSFFGHRVIDDFTSAEKKVDRLIRSLLMKSYVEFLVGRGGDFDQIVASTVKRLKRIIRDDNNALVWVLPYCTAELRDNAESFHAYYDEIEICDDAANSHPKKAYQIRNRKMVDRSDLAVFYVNRNSGGAYQTLQYAKKQQKAILNLAWIDTWE